MSDEEGELAQQAQQAQQAGLAQQAGSADSLPAQADESLPGSPKAADEPPAAGAAAAGVAGFAQGTPPPAQPSPVAAAAAQQPPPQRQEAQPPQAPQQAQAPLKPQLPQPTGLAIQSSEDVEAAAAALPSGGAVLFGGRCQWVTPKRVLPGRLQVTATQMHFIADLAGGSPGISAWLSGATGGSGSRDSSAAQLVEGAEGAASPAAEELPPKRRHRRWQLSGLTEVHHRLVSGLADGLYSGEGGGVAHSPWDALRPCLPMHATAANLLVFPDLHHGTSLLATCAASSPTLTPSPAPYPPCRSRYLLQATALECFMADRTSHAFFNFPSQQARVTLCCSGGHISCCSGGHTSCCCWRSHFMLLLAVARHAAAGVAACLHAGPLKLARA